MGRRLRCGLEKLRAERRRGGIVGGETGRVVGRERGRVKRRGMFGTEKSEWYRSCRRGRYLSPSMHVIRYSSINVFLSLRSRKSTFPSIPPYTHSKSPNPTLPPRPLYTAFLGYAHNLLVTFVGPVASSSSGPTPCSTHLTSASNVPAGYPPFPPKQCASPGAPNTR